MSDARVLATEAVESHVRAFFEGHSVEAVGYDLGPERREVAPDLRVLVVGPGPRSDSWAYVTAGCWAAMEKDGHGLEFVMTAHVSDQRFIELMAMIAYYHCGGHQLDLEHSMPSVNRGCRGRPAITCWSACPISTDQTLNTVLFPGATPASCGPCP
ncbi:hypothetical protein [Streptomyces sp. B1I3]|uniref:hypothetical protein n=1 Tax=Streptomyces sp. B1I3 TaxID=3042264 RepID=UPI00278718C2|nr:hypothetical protein [Streptomyces sp. B1I3]MDQ0798126.1 hypothetical protein [Streptomyces sp. B1I3]